MYIETWLFWVVVVLLCAIFGTVIGSINSQLKYLQKTANYDIKVLKNQVKKLQKMAMRHHPDYGPED